MARGRFISKDISLDEKVDALSDDTARLLFTWMIPHLDCEGRMYGDAQLFKSLVAPRRNYSLQKVERVLTELVKLGLVVRYEVNKNRYLFAPNFDKNQPGLKKEREAKSNIPAPPDSIIRNNTGVTQELLRSKTDIKQEECQSNSHPSISISLSKSISIREDKEEVEEIPATASTEKKELEFNEFAEDLRSKYPDLDFDLEMRRFKTYWSEGNRKLKRPKTALLNWMEHAREFKKERGGDGKHRQHSESTGISAIKASVGRAL